MNEDWTEDPGPRMQLAAERHMTAVWDAYYEQSDSDDEWAGESAQAPQVDSPAVGPFCGCETCVVREVLAGAWPVIEDYIRLRTQAGPHPLG